MTRHTARPDPRPMGVPGSIRSSAAWAAASRARWSGSVTRAACHPARRMGSIDDLPHRIREARGEPEGALVLLHGRGPSEDDLFPLFDERDPDGRLGGVTPRAPLQLPPGGNHWYVVRRVGFPDPSTFGPVMERLEGWFDALPDALGVAARGPAA